uniref:Uncharacterized protein n=1 Tax=Manihot esculenta TaxID=3983 RepID=A0A2C9VAP5_MANES
MVGNSQSKAFLKGQSCESHHQLFSEQPELHLLLHLYLHFLFLSSPFYLITMAHDAFGMS